MTITDVGKDDFWDTVASGTVLVDVWSEQCQPCLRLTPHLEELATERDDIVLAKLEAPRARRLLMDLKVRGLPTLLLFRDGEEIARLADARLGPDRATAWVREQLDPQPDNDHDNGAEPVPEKEAP